MVQSYLSEYLNILQILLCYDVVLELQMPAGTTRVYLRNGYFHCVAERETDTMWYCLWDQI